MRLWLTRDSDVDGNLMPYVDVWLQRPKLSECGPLVCYISDDGDLTWHVISLDLDESLRHFNTYPRSTRSILVVDRKSPEEAAARKRYLRELQLTLKKDPR